MLQVNHLTLTHSKDSRVLIQDLSFTINDSGKTVIIGEEGNGKSTLLRLIHDPALVENYIEVSGQIRKNGMRSGYLSQELTEPELQMPVYAYMAEMPGFPDATPRELAAVCRQTGIPMDMLYDDRPMGTLSGGEKVRLRLAGLMLSEPDILLLDEPSANLDMDGLIWLEEYLKNCRIPVLFISHDETLIETCADSVIHLEQTIRKTVPRSTFHRIPYREYIGQRDEALAKNEQLAEKERAEFRKKMERYRQICQKVEHQQNTISRGDPHGGRLLKKKMHTVKAMGRRFEKEEAGLTKKIDVEEAIMISFADKITHPAGKTILDFRLEELKSPDGNVLSRGIGLFVSGGEKVCIIGRNGMGKSTLLRQIWQEMAHRPDLRPAYMPQEYSDLLDFNDTPTEFLMQRGLERSKVRTYLGSVKFTPDEMSHPIGALSGGQKAKLFFLDMILSGADTLILDEPTRNFSPLSGPVIREILASFGGTIIAVTHDRKLIDEVFDTVYALTEEGLIEA
ncbi:MAG: ABC-F family ATP-binding cassette domain-containing protein [Ruminococcaceae bacterium]|nr:ABC-F family ATP-binding cassette domain-containing protein [Oscillospiraceae bacterium]